MNQKRRQLNERIRKLLSHHGTQRGVARVLGCDPKTVARKLVFLGKQAEREHREVLLHLHQAREGEGSRGGGGRGGIRELQFDELQTSHHTKLKPLSVPLVVETRTRLILGWDVCEMPASGRLARLSMSKYGRRRDQRVGTLHELFRSLKPFLSPQARFLSDSHPFYPPVIRRHYPRAHHEVTLGRAACVAGQGELKRGGWDPLFSLNHTCAMLRAHVSRLIRKTWCTTKRVDRLSAHLALYVQSHNRRILSEGARI